MSGKYKGDDFFASLLQAIVMKADKEERGVGMQGFRYSPDLLEFAHIVATHSPRAYRFIKDHLPLPTPRTIERQRAHCKRPPIGIHDRGFDLVHDNLISLQYDGPVGLSCDDTKLMSAFRPYYDQEHDAHFILGNTGEPYRLIDPEAFQDVLDSGVLEKATKLRLWCLQVPIPKVPTMVVASLGINDLSAETLIEYLWQVIQGLLSRNIKVRSYACDGTSVERSVQKLLEERATRVVTYMIIHPGINQLPIQISIPVFGDNPIANIQDPKHGLKTYHNNVFSGARVITFPHHVVMYSQVHAIAFEDGPLYHRDVEKLDRQDDNAATRLFSGATLEWLNSKHSEHLGLVIYLFVFGELIDAYQNRRISIIARVQMVLRAFFFMELWESFLDKAGYSKSRHFLSHEACDITRILIHGLLKLVFIYRDHVPLGARALLFWLLTSEPCEHVYGLARKIVVDFNLLDFFYMFPKLYILLRESVFSDKFSNGKACASGYNHTYTDNRGINFIALSTFPSDEEINQAAQQAYGEAENLFALLGVFASQLQNSSAPRLPGIRSWFIDSTTSGRTSNRLDPADSDDDFLETDEDVLLFESDDEEPSNIQEVLDHLEHVVGSTQREDKEIINYTYAAVAISIDEHVKINALPEPDEGDITRDLAHDAATIAESLAACLPPPNTDDKTTIFDLQTWDTAFLDMDELVKICFAHQTKQALTGVRTHVKAASITPSPGKQKQSQKQHVQAHLNEIIKGLEERGVDSGLARTVRWQNGKNSNSGDGSVLAGNASNAAEAANTQAKKLLTRRKNAFKKENLPVELHNARVTDLAPVCVADSDDSDGASNTGSSYGFIVLDGRIMLGKVLAIYSKSGGKNGKHSSIMKSSNVSAVSYFVLQVFEQMVSQQFRSIPEKLQSLQSNKFTLLPSSAFLCILDTAPRSALETGLWIGIPDHIRFNVLTKKILIVMKALKSRRKNAADSTHMAEEDGDDD